MINLVQISNYSTTSLIRNLGDSHFSSNYTIEPHLLKIHGIAILVRIVGSF
jgi:hypothetical protein